MVELPAPLRASTQRLTFNAALDAFALNAQRELRTQPDSELADDIARLSGMIVTKIGAIQGHEQRAQIAEIMALVQELPLTQEQESASQELVDRSRTFFSSSHPEPICRFSGPEGRSTLVLTKEFAAESRLLSQKASQEGYPIQKIDASADIDPVLLEKLSGCRSLSDASRLLADPVTEMAKLIRIEKFFDMPILRQSIQACINNLSTPDVIKMAKNLAVEGIYLQRLDLTRDCENEREINDEDLEEICVAQPKLEALNLTGCTKLTSSIGRSLNRLEHLQELDLSGSGIDDRIGKYLKTMKLTKLCAAQCQIGDALVKDLAAIRTLQWLDLSSRSRNLVWIETPKKLTSAIGESLVQLPNLKVLALRSSAIDNGFGKYLSQLTSLTSLDLADCDKVTDAIGREMGSLKALQTLSLRETGCEGKISIYLDQLPLLSHVEINYGENLDERQQRRALPIDNNVWREAAR